MKHWVRTSSGKDIDLLNPDPKLIDINDIAHALARINRFSGNTREAYSVAEHSVRVARAVADAGADNEVQLRALLHDAPEAYIGDITAPVKAIIREHTNILDVIENRIWRAICDSFFLPHWRHDPTFVEPPVIKQMDLVLLATEWRDLMRLGPTDVSFPEPPLKRKMAPSPNIWAAEDAFLQMYEALHV